MSNHERIFLGPECEPNRLWCQDQVFEDCDGQCGGDNHEPICYVREDIHKARVAELESRLQACEATMARDHNEYQMSLERWEAAAKESAYRLDKAAEAMKAVGIGATSDKCWDQWDLLWEIVVEGGPGVTDFNMRVVEKGVPK